MPAVSAPQGKPLDVARTFQQALEFHHQGRIAEAEQLYSAVLNVRPEHFETLQMLGVIKLTRGDLPAALRYVGAALKQRPTSPQDLPMTVVIPAYVISEIKTGFQMGFFLFVPFLLIDLIVSTTLLSMGMLQLPPAMIALPFKLLLFVMIDGWALVIGSLIRSFV